MSEKDRLHLEEMLGAIDEIAFQVSGAVEIQWIDDRTKVAATSMYLIVLGEGAGSLSDDLKAQAPEIPWSDIAGLRHRLAHGYFRADRRIIWQTATAHVPTLKSVLTRLLACLDTESR